MNKKQLVHSTVLLLLLALVCVTAATLAWFSIADKTRVKSMSMEITTGSNLRFDLDGHDSFEEYVKTLGFDQIAARMKRDKGFDMSEVPLQPLTSSDYRLFTYENGKAADSSSGEYLEFVLHFCATEDMYVYLTGENGQGETNGTLVTSSNKQLKNAMRISFTTDGATSVYDPGLAAEDIELFYLEKDTDKAVTVHIWLEGTDEACTDEIKGADYQIRLRFVGKDENKELLD